MNNVEFAIVLRGLADLYEQHEKLPQFIADRIYTYVPDKETMTLAVQVLGAGKKESVNDCINYRPDKWPLSLWASKSALGCQVIEETVTIPEQVIPGRKRKVIPARTETRKIYKCEPLLAPFFKAEDTTPKLLEAAVANE